MDVIFHLFLCGRPKKVPLQVQYSFMHTKKTSIGSRVRTLHPTPLPGVRLGELPCSRREPFSGSGRRVSVGEERKSLDRPKGDIMVGKKYPSFSSSVRERRNVT